MTLGTPLSAVLNPATGKAIPLTVRFLANNLLNGQNQGVELNGGLVAVMELPINQLPGPGLYTWKVAIYGDGMDEQCLHQGFFFVTRSADDLMTATARALITPTPMPTVEFTDEATQDGTIIPIFQGNIPIPGGSG